MFFFFFSSRRRHTRFDCDWSSDMCSSDLGDRALENNTSGSNNTALGSGALFSNDTGSQNVALGALAGVNLTTGDNNIDIGSPVPRASPTLSGLDLRQHTRRCLWPESLQWSPRRLS